MTPEEKKTLLMGNIKEPTVIRGLYQPIAMKMNTKQIIDMFGNISLPVEIYDTHDTETTAADMGKSTLPKLFKHWKRNLLPRLYCAEVDLFEQKIPRKLLETLRNPNTEPKEVEALMLYLGKDHKSGLHLHVNSDFVLNQLFGSKTVYIFNNYDNPNIHKNSTFHMGKSNFAKEDFFQLDHSKMKIYKVTLQPGDSLMIPPWSWHATQGHGINMSLTQIFDRSDLMYLLANPNMILDYVFEDQIILFSILIIIFVIYYMRRRKR
tara:strand:- start:909 stop:1700 length:792 start_codon:yes stop_codon:yes gene_type:complete